MKYKNVYTNMRACACVHVRVCVCVCMCVYVFSKLLTKMIIQKRRSKYISLDRIYIGFRQQNYGFCLVLMQ